MCDFSSARVGDRVWSVELGWGTVRDNGVGSVLSYPIQVKFDNKGLYHSYTADGKWDVAFEKPTLFWAEVKIVPPPKPKRKVKRVIEGWVSLFLPAEGRNDGVVAGVTYGCTNIFETRESLRRHKESLYIPNLVFLGDPIFIRHEYEDFE